jgi:hypothetical protein
MVWVLRSDSAAGWRARSVCQMESVAYSIVFIGGRLLSYDSL